MSEVNERTQRTSLLRGPVTDIPGLTTYLAGLGYATTAYVDDEIGVALGIVASQYFPLAGGTLAGDLDMDAHDIIGAQTINAGSFLKGGLQLATEAFASNASNLASGTVPDARLSANVTLLGNTTTGTGSVVRATSPTLVTPNLGSATCVTINGAFIGASGLNFVCGGNGVIVASDKVFGFSNSTNPQGTRDVTAVRNATGPTLETRAAGGLKVCNADGSALAAIECDSGSKSSPGIRMGGASNTGLYSSANGTTPGLGLAISGSSFVYTSDAGTGFIIHPAWGYCWGSSQADSSVDTRITRSSAGVLDIGTTSDNTLGSLNLMNLTSSGVAKFTGYPTGLLPAAASNAGSITYDTTLAKHVGCNGTNWNTLW